MSVIPQSHSWVNDNSTTSDCHFTAQPPNFERIELIEARIIDGEVKLKVHLDHKKERIDGTESIVDLRSWELMSFLIRKEDQTTFAELEKELGLSREVIRSMINALEPLGYLAVNRRSSDRILIRIDDKLFFGECIAEEIKKCLQELATNTSENAFIKVILENLPEEAIARFDDGDLWSATKMYNEVVEKLIKAGIKVFPLIEWKRIAYKIGLGPKFGKV